jgi:hypothetical protein
MIWRLFCAKAQNSTGLDILYSVLFLIRTIVREKWLTSSLVVVWVILYEDNEKFIYYITTNAAVNRGC